MANLQVLDVCDAGLLDDKAVFSLLVGYDINKRIMKYTIFLAPIIHCLHIQAIHIDSLINSLNSTIILINPFILAIKLLNITYSSLYTRTWTHLCFDRIKVTWHVYLFGNELMTASCQCPLGYSGARQISLTFQELSGQNSVWFLDHSICTWLWSLRGWYGESTG